MTKNFETQVIPRKNITILKEETHAAPSVTIMSPASWSGGSGERLGGEGNSKMEQRGPSSKHTACVVAVRLPWQ